ncbi:16S rRNA (guanine(527)-N(7))-methyltransferase RsmG [Henriciella aquimarina]|uniref:16S rRNA (guanine(527)-N(7))-methyltransferase RsmG n=1 Tax=Henriciella aquimarina TaxID=545261 RepID=UPI000A0229B6|nr:16S rRNA (guanine(527)-N(7))-methyltransferase RsmG [Henriciella aquimarina]
MTENEARQALADLDVSRETLDRLERLVALLDEWRQRMNLIGPREMDQIWARHVFDSAQLIPLVTRQSRILDIGSGAGFPGLVLACHVAEGDGSVILLESVGKKCAFLSAAISELALPAKVLNKRIESVEAGTVDFVTARALAPLRKLLDYSAPWLLRGATGLFFKGEHWREELTEASEYWNLAYEAIPSRTSETGVILKIMEAQRV